MLNTFKFYGANRIFEIPDRSALLPVSWSHGVIWGKYDPGVLFSQQDSLASLHLVANEDEYEICPFEGKKIIAGLPIIYHHTTATDNLCIDRLYIPRHGISGESLVNELDQLAETADKIGACSVLIPATDFNRLCKSEDICLHNGIKFFKGAHSGDPSSLSRIASIFKSTKIISTDCLGSHIYYGALFECSLEVSTNSLEFMSKSKIDRVLRSYPTSRKQIMEDYFLDKETKICQLNRFLSLNKNDQYNLAARICGLDFKDLSISESINFELLDIFSYRLKLFTEKFLSKW